MVCNEHIHLFHQFPIFMRELSGSTTQIKHQPKILWLGCYSVGTISEQRLLSCSARLK